VLLQSATPGVCLPATTLKALTPSRVAIADLYQDGRNDLAGADLNDAWLYFRAPAFARTYSPRGLVRP
jgi:hypothetical protein